jgi:hypothetical protein
MRLAASIACALALTSCQTIREAIPPSPLKVCPVRMLNPLKEGEKRWVYVNLYSRQW